MCQDHDEANPRAAALTAETSARLHAAYDSLPGIFLFCADGSETLLFANPEALALYQCDSLDALRSALGTTFSSLLLPDDYLPLAEVLEVLSAMRRDNRQAWIMQPDGSYLRPEGAGEPFVSQAYLHTYFAGRTIEKPAPPAPPQPRKKLPWWRRLWIWLKNN